MVKVGIVGVGNIGSIHADVYKNNPKCKVVAVCNIIKAKADAAAASTELLAPSHSQDGCVR